MHAKTTREFSLEMAVFATRTRMIVVPRTPALYNKANFPQDFYWGKINKSSYAFLKAASRVINGSNLALFCYSLAL